MQKHTLVRIAISYRQNDTVQIVGRIHERLQNVFGDENVFLDFEEIKPSNNIRDAINQALDRCNVLVAVIGEKWMGSVQPDGRPALFKPDDWVHAELAAALARQMHIIPVVIDDAKMPNPAELPEQLADFGYILAVPVSVRKDFHPSMENLIKVIRTRWGNAPQTKREQARAAYVLKIELAVLSWMWRFMVAIFSGALLFLLGAYIFGYDINKPASESHSIIRSIITGLLMVPGLFILASIPIAIMKLAEKRYMRRYDRTSRTTKETRQ